MGKEKPQKMYLRNVMGGRAGPMGTVTKKIQSKNCSGELCEMTASVLKETERFLPKFL